MSNDEQARRKAQKRRDMAQKTRDRHSGSAWKGSKPRYCATKKSASKVCRRNNSLHWPPAGAAGMQEARRLSQLILLYGSAV